MKIKEALDPIFEGVSFDTNLYKKIARHNISFITQTPEHKSLFGGKLIGCYAMTYTYYHKRQFYDNIFNNLEMSDVTDAISQIDTFPKSFKIARDDINLVTFYIAHRFLSNQDLSKQNREKFAKEILNYFSYRNLVLISSSYWVYPMSEDKAVTLIERLSNKYSIKKMKNWNEYCHYRSEEYLKSKFYDLLVSFKEDDDIPNAISDLFNRVKEMLKNIYREFLDMLENDTMISSSKNVMTDLEGKEVIVDRIDTPALFITRVENALVDKGNFIRSELLEVTVSIIDSVSYRQLEECLNITNDYYYLGRKESVLLREYANSFLISSLDYLQKNRVNMSGQGNIIKVVNSITGNLLYSRTTDSSINKVKEDGEVLIKDIYKKAKISITDRTIKNVRNAFSVYILLLSLV